MSMTEERTFVRMKRRDGIKCPCCTQYVKEYRRTLNGRMARALLTIATSSSWASAEQRFRWLDVPKLLIAKKDGSGDYGKLRHWGLIEPAPRSKATVSRTSGKWRITMLGMKFARGEAKVPAYAWIFDDHLTSMDGELVTIRDCFPKKFDFGELMAGMPRFPHVPHGV